MPQSPVTVLIDRLALTDEEVLAIFDVDPLSLISGALVHRPELAILVSLSAAAADRVGEPVLRRWLRVEGPAGRPIALLEAGDFGGFEDAVTLLLERGLVIGGRTRPAAGLPAGDDGHTGGL